MSQNDKNVLTARFNDICSQRGINSIDALKASMMHNPTADIIEAYKIFMLLTSNL